MLKKLLVLAALLTWIPMGYIPTVAHADAAKYELSIKLVPTASLLTAHPKARTIDYPASAVEGHSDFASKDECEAHFEMGDIPGIAIAMAQNAGLKLDEDFTIEHVCEPAKIGI